MWRNLLLCRTVFFSAVFVFSLFILNAGAFAAAFAATNLNGGSLRQAVLHTNKRFIRILIFLSSLQYLIT